jgi:hypothetical protein
VTTYFRHSFNVPDPGSYSSFTVALLRDDGGAVYINGTEVFRSNLKSGVPIGYLDLATNALAQDEIDFFYTNTFTTPVLVQGTNVCAVEIHQSSVTSSDLSFDLKLFGNFASALQLKQARLSGGGLALYWDDTAAILEQTSDPGGGWGPAPGEGNPRVIPMNAGGQFYRLRR